MIVEREKRMDNQFNTMDFYKDKVSKGIFLITVAGILAAILVCVLGLCMNFCDTTPRYMFWAFIVIGMLEILGLTVFYKRVFRDKEIGENEYTALKYILNLILVLNFTMLVNIIQSQAMWTMVVFFVIIGSLFQDFKLTRRFVVIYGIIIVIFFYNAPY